MINRKLITHFFLFWEIYQVFNTLINIGVDKYAALYKCMYIFIIGNQLTTQNNNRYCPETLTGTAFSIKNMLKS